MCISLSFFSSSGLYKPLVLCTSDSEMRKMSHPPTDLISSVTSQNIVKCAGKIIRLSLQWCPDSGISHDLFCWSLLGHCITGLQLHRPNLLNKDISSSVKVRSPLWTDGMASLDFNFYPGKEKTKFESFYVFSATNFNWQLCNSLERHNYRLAQTWLNFAKKEVLYNFLFQGHRWGRL